jgi:DNA-binding CsgD family transcriptional regulator
MLTTFDLDEYVYEALRAGASGFLLKDAAAAELVHAVRVVAAGEALLAPSVTRRLIADFANRPRPATGGHPRPGDPIAQLTPREAEVLTLIARGMSNAEISASLVIAEQTTKTHVGRILMKLGLRDRAQAVVFAYESGLVTPGELELQRLLHLQRDGRVAEAVVQGAGGRVLAVYVESDGRHAPCARLGLGQQHRCAPVPAAAVAGLDLDVVHPGHHRVVLPGHRQPERADRLVPGQHPEHELSRRVQPGGEHPRGIPPRLLPRLVERQGARGRDQLGVPGHLPRQPFVVLGLCRRPQAERVPLHRDI